jgi:dihydropteroate synthase
MINPTPPLIFGILNFTPNSFSDGGQFFTPQEALQHAHRLIAEGADFIDVGAEATNPWAEPLTADQEWQRLQTILPDLVKAFPGKLSLDTYHAAVAEQGLEMGVSFINDVTMFRDPAMVALAARYHDQARFIVSHLSPKASSIAQAHKLMPTGSVEEVKSELLLKRQELITAGVAAGRIILDPGIGFGKIKDHDWALHWQLLEFAQEVPGIEVMVGYSRKRFLGENKQAIEPNLEAARIAIESGARYLRVHDVAAHRQLIDSL